MYHMSTINPISQIIPVGFSSGTYGASLFSIQRLWCIRVAFLKWGNSKSPLVSESYTLPITWILTWDLNMMVSYFKDDFREKGTGPWSPFHWDWRPRGRRCPRLHLGFLQRVEFSVNGKGWKVSTRQWHSGVAGSWRSKTLTTRSRSRGLSQSMSTSSRAHVSGQIR